MKKTKAFIKLRSVLPERLCLCWIPAFNSTKKNTQPQMESSEDEPTEVDIEKEYMPHKWSTKYHTPEEVLQQYTRFITTESEAATNTIPNSLDVEYGSSVGQKLDIFGTDLPDDAPILVYIHGGYWKQISKNISRFPALSLHKAGIKTIVVGYDQRSHVTLWGIIDQMVDAILYVLKYSEEKGSRGVYLAGHDSGAHLIGEILGNYELFGCNLIKQLNAVYFISGLYDLRNFCLTSTNDSIDIHKIDAVSLSPIFKSYTHLLDSNVRIYILAAEEDSPTFKDQSREYYKVLFDICPMKNMYLEIKENMDHYDIVKCLANDDNYLKNLILHDLRNHCSED